MFGIRQYRRVRTPRSTVHPQPCLRRIGHPDPVSPSLATLRALRGRVLSEIGPDGEQERLIDSADELVETLSRQFHLDVPEVRELWPRIVERHAN